MTQRGRQPDTVQDALRSLADWLDEADRLIDRLAASRGIERHNSGDEVQQDMRRLALWFDDHPEASASAADAMWFDGAAAPERGEK